MFTTFQNSKGPNLTKVCQKARSYLDNHEAGETERAVAALEKAMEKDHLYLDPELSLNSLATHLDLPPKMLSAVLNQVLQKGFSEYVNDLLLFSRSRLMSKREHCYRY